MDRAVALLSGGLDSVVALALWRERGGGVLLCLTFDYGQRARAQEARTAEDHAGRLGLPWRILELPWLAEAASASAIVDPRRELPAGTPEQPGDEASAAAVWVPARNLVFLAAASALAEAAGAGVLLTGFNREEAATFPDNSREFLEAMNSTLTLASRTPLRVESPTLDMDKAQIAAAARRLGFGPEDFWSCYGAGPEPCGRCEPCLRSARAWEGLP